MLAFLVSAIRLGMTFLFGSTGETITEKSGHLNLGIPGVMCVGASCGCFAEYLYLSAARKSVVPFLAVLIPILATVLGGAVMGLIYCFLTVTLRANQNVTGLALTTFGVGVSDFMIAKTGAIYSRGTRYFTASLPFADDLGWFGELFLSHGILIYLAIVIALVSSFVLTKTRIGLNLRAVGENPATADAAGINVARYRYVSTCIGCGIAGLGGLSFIMDYLHGNWEYCIDAIGWLAIALVIFTVWKPNLGIVGSLVFGALYIASSFITGVSFASKELFKMLPYVVTIVVLIFTSIRDKKENQPPAHLGLNYFREER
ncbi:MAG: ABC transporter permease [Clostridia bacterium]|nr:ABC transporter permease [Oscillospiraceae bacterium]MBQ2749248.1 ABC transporter permease [Clostridia bacterium]MBQ4624889.1 ABC transporter permease [Clostridia bacterium]MBR6764560.1 ABC transporter permease [Clostridia bacterium]